VGEATSRSSDRAELSKWRGQSRALLRILSGREVILIRRAIGAVKQDATSVDFLVRERRRESLG
jgi:hypothetical protein